MKKFKCIFFIYLIVLVCIYFSLDKTDNLNYRLADSVYSEVDIDKAVKLESAILDLGMKSEEDVTSKVVNESKVIKLNTLNLNSENDKSTMYLRINNKYSNKKVDVEIKCSSSSDYISVYPDKNKYTIDENKDANVLITVLLNKDKVYDNVNVDYQCEIVSSLSQ